MDSPNGWQFRTVGDLCTFSSGNGFGPAEWEEHGLPIIRIQNLNGSRDFNYFAGEPDPAWIVEPGDLLFAWAGVQGVSFGATEWAGPRGVLNQHIYRVRSNGEVQQEWVKLVLHEVTQRIERKAHGFKSNLVHVRKADITEQLVPVPPERERQRIVEIASSMSHAEACMARTIDLHVKRLEGLMQQLLSGRRRLPAFAQSGTRDDRSVGVMPADWQTVALSDIVKKVKRRNEVGETHVLTASGRHGLVDQTEFFNRSVAGSDLSGYYLLKRGEFAYNRSRMNGYTYGAIKRLDRYPQGALSTLYLCFRLTSKDVDSDFLCWYFEGGQMGRQLRRVTPVGGRAHGLLNITENDFYSIKIMLPPLDEQREIAEVLDTAQREIDLLVARREQIQKQKRGLMQKLLTGEIRVPV